MPQLTKKTSGPSKRRQGIERPIVVLFLVFVTVVVAITNAFWMGGLASNLTKREQVEIPIVSATKLGDDGWTIMAQLKNTGGADATINGLFIDGKASYELGPGAVTVAPDLSFSVPAGSGKTAMVTVKNGTWGFCMGATIDLTFRSSAGRSYAKAVLIP
jgi:hypothetical protein